MCFDTRPCFSMPQNIQTRWASFENPDGAPGAGGKTNGGRKGAAWAPVRAGESVVLAHAENTSGIIRRIWMTINDRSPMFLRGVRLDFYWDGAEKPAVSAPIGDFFGHGIGRMCTFDSALFSSPEGRSFNSFVQMPFKRAMKLVLTNECPRAIDMLFYDVDYTIGDELGDDTLYFHTHFRRERETQYKKDYQILPQVSGKGRYLGVNFGVIANKDLYFDTWWGEGECKVYIDGDTQYPTLCGTGTEDYIGDAWSQYRFAHLYQGCPVADAEPDKMEFCFYRYHLPDPVYFYQSIRIEMFQIGCYFPHHRKMLLERGLPVYTNGPGYKEIDFTNAPEFGLFEREKDDWSSCVYFYLDSPESGLPAMDSYEERVAGLLKDDAANDEFAMKVERNEDVK